MSFPATNRSFDIPPLQPNVSRVTDLNLSGFQGPLFDTKLPNNGFFNNNEDNILIPQQISSNPQPHPARPNIPNPMKYPCSLQFKVPGDGIVGILPGLKHPKTPQTESATIQSLSRKIPNPFSEKDESYSTPYLLHWLILIRNEMERCDYFVNYTNPDPPTPPKKEDETKVKKVFDIPQGGVNLSYETFCYSYDHLQCLFLRIYLTLCHSENVIDDDHPLILQYPRPTKSEFEHYSHHVVKTTQKKPSEFGGNIHPLTPLELTARMGPISQETLDKCIYRILRYPVLDNRKSLPIDYILRISPSNPHGFTEHDLKGLKELTTTSQKHEKVQTLLETKLKLKVKDKSELKDKIKAWVSRRLQVTLDQKDVINDAINSGVFKKGANVIVNNAINYDAIDYDFINNKKNQFAIKDEPNGEVCYHRGGKTKAIFNIGLKEYQNGIFKHFLLYLQQMNLEDPIFLGSDCQELQFVEFDGHQDIKLEDDQSDDPNKIETNSVAQVNDHKNGANVKPRIEFNLNSQPLQFQFSLQLCASIQCNSDKKENTSLDFSAPLSQIQSLPTLNVTHSLDFFPTLKTQAAANVHSLRSPSKDKTANASQRYLPPSATLQAESWNRNWFNDSTTNIHLCVGYGVDTGSIDGSGMDIGNRSFNTPNGTVNQDRERNRNYTL
jgi:hypothetical protein